MISSPCVGSGACCKTAPCPYGEVTSPTNPACRFLEVRETHGDVAIYQCGKYDEIVGQPGADVVPAFGAGCCMSLFNTARNQIIQLIQLGEIDRPYPPN